MTRTSSRLLKSALAALSIAMPFAAAADTNPLVAERWKTRPVVVVVPAAGDPLLRKVEAALRQTATREAFIDREMVLYTVVAGEGRRNDNAMAPAQTRALLDALKLEAAGAPTFVLVGKDGGVKMTEGAGVDLQAVFAEIDRMPMRQR
jgi:ABC-type sugar transport system substrate-binding protein